MSKKRVLQGLTVVLGLASVLFFSVGPGFVERGQNQIASHAPYDISAEAQALHKTLFIGDLHTDSTLWGRDLLERSERGHVDLPRMREGNVALVSFPAVTYVPSGLNYESNEASGDLVKWLMCMQLRYLPTWYSVFERVMNHADVLIDMERTAPDQFMLVRARADLDQLVARRAAGESILGGIMSFEGAQVFEGKLENIDFLYGVGFRIMELTHFFDNELGGSLHGTAGSGLTDFGRAAVRRMDDLGAIIDVAHASENMVQEVLDMGVGPLVVSHTGLKGACDTKRNISDELMTRIADAGGLIGVGFWDAAVCDITPAGIAKSIRYAIDLLGLDHVALGSDWDGATTVAMDASELAALTQALLDDGLSEAEIRAVMGGNMLRFLMENLPE